MKMRRKSAIVSAAPPAPAPPATSTIPIVTLITWLTQASLIVALVTLVGAWYVLLFEAGYFSYFHLPYYFVSLSPSIVLGTSEIWIVFLLILCGLAISVIIVVSIFGWLVNRLKRKRPERGEMREPIVLIVVIGIILIAFFVLYATFGGYYFSNLGNRKAESQIGFPVFTPTSYTSEVAVIRSYGEYLYAIPFNRKTNEHEAQFESKLVIVKMSDVKTPLSFEEIGPLKSMKPKE
jgi:hypothetical protein